MENQEYKKMVLFMSTGYAGMDAVEFWKIQNTSVLVLSVLIILQYLSK